MKKLFRRRHILSTVITIVVIFLIIFSGPVSAVIISISTDKTDYNANDNLIIFTAQVDVESRERIPIQNLTIKITGPNSFSKNCTFSPSGVNLTACSNLNITVINLRSYGSGSLFGYGFGYDFGYGSWNTANQTFGTGYGYGYESGYEYNSSYYAELAYNITWNISAESTPLRGGAYGASLEVFAEQGSNARIYASVTSTAFNYKKSPSFSLNSTNSTSAGKLTQFRLKWSDDVNLSGYIFSFSNCTSALNLVETTTVKLQNPDNETLEDVGINFYIGGDPGSHRGLFKFNISSLPSGVVITDAKLYLYAYTVSSPWDGDVNVFRINNQTWTEDYDWQSLWATKDQRTNYSLYTSKWSSTGWDYVNVTDAVSMDYNSGNRNVSFWLEDPDFNTTDANNKLNSASSYITLGYRIHNDDAYVRLRSKEDTTYRPFLNITYASMGPSYINDTWIAFSGTENWSNVTKTVNSTVGCTIRWKVYANNTYNIWNTSSTYSFVTTDTDAPLWNETSGYLGSNTSSPYLGDAVNLYSMLKDSTALDWAWLSINETGVWRNQTNYGSPKDMNDATGWTWANFTWKNSSISGGTVVGWRVYFNDTSGNENVSDIGTFTVNTPGIRFSSNSTNSTGAGKPVQFRLRWSDDVGLSGYVFSFDNCTSGSESGITYTIKLQNADSETLEDATIWYNNGGFYDYLRTLIKFSIASIPAGAAITDAKLYLYRSTGSGWDETVNVYRINNQTWTEDYDVPSLWSMNTQRANFQQFSKWPANGWDYVNVTDIVLADYNSGSRNTSIWLESTRNSTAPDTIWTTEGTLRIGGQSSWVQFRSKEYGTTSTRPYLNITYVVNGSSFVNDTWIAFSGTENWSNVTKTVNSTVGCTIRWKVYANNTYNIWNTSSTYSFATTDIEKPVWSSNRSYSPTYYSLSTPSLFNISWQDNIGINASLIEIKDSLGSVIVNNKTMVNSFGGDVYNYSIVLPVGTFTWKSYANDSSGNWNVSHAWNFTIAKASSEIHLALNGSESNKSYVYPKEINVTGWLASGPSYAPIYLLKNGSYANVSFYTQNNASQTSWNETFTGSQNKTFYIRLPKNSSVTNAEFYLNGIYNIETRNLTNHYQNNDSSSAYAARGFQVNLTNFSSYSNDETCSIRWKIKKPCSAPCDSNARCLVDLNDVQIANLTSDCHVTDGWKEFNFSCSNLNSGYAHFQITPTPWGCNLCFAYEEYPLDSLDSPEGYQATNEIWVEDSNRDFGFELYVYKRVYPTNPYVDIGGDGTADWSYSGEFDENGQVGDFSGELTSYLSGCTPANDGSCDVPFYLHSDSAGIIEVSSINISVAEPTASENLSVGTYSYAIVYEGNQNFSSNSTTYFLSLNESSSSCSLAGVSNHTYGTTDTILCSCSGGGTTHLYQNNTLRDDWNNSAKVYENGTYSWTCNITASTNFSVASTSKIQVINISSTAIGTYTNNTVSSTANTIGTINATTTSNTSIHLQILTTSNVTNSSISITEYNSTPPGTTSTGIYGINKFFEINPGYALNSSLGWVLINLSYSDDDVTSAKLNESSLRLYRYNSALSSWTEIPGGVDTVSNYVWGNLTSFSFYGIGGTKVNGESCNSSTECYSGYCVHGYCRASSTYCGDGFCDSGESCTLDNSGCSSGYTCTNGCVATQTQQLGGVAVCTYDWQCSDWSSCEGGLQMRTCSNKGTCTGTKGKPIESQSCTLPAPTNVTPPATTTLPATTTTPTTIPIPTAPAPSPAIPLGLGTALIAVMAISLVIIFVILKRKKSSKKLLKGPYG